MDQDTVNIVMTGNISMLSDNEGVSVLSGSDQSMSVMSEDGMLSQRGNMTLMNSDENGINLTVVGEDEGMQVICQEQAIQVMDHDEAMHMMGQESVVLQHSDMIVTDSMGRESDLSMMGGDASNMDILSAEDLTSVGSEETLRMNVSPIGQQTSMMLSNTSQECMKDDLNDINSKLNTNSSTSESVSISTHGMVRVFYSDTQSDIPLIKNETTYCHLSYSNNVDDLQADINNKAPSEDEDEHPIKFKSEADASNETSDRVYKCSQCDYETHMKNNFNRHMTKHNPDQELLSCPSCSFTTIYRHSLKRHMFTHPESKDKPLLKDTPPKSEEKYVMYCNQCKYSTNNVQAFKRHQLKHVSPENKPVKMFACKMCEYVSKYKQHYERHLLKHTGEKTYKCIYCDYATAYIDNHKRHLAKHTKTKSFRCRYCSYTSAYSDNFKRHLMKHSQEQTYSCKSCSYSSAYVENYERHLLKHVKKNRYQCESCKYSTAYKENFRRHTLKHTGEKVHSCPYCSYKTVYIDNYRRHVTVHTGEGAQTCDHCSYSTTIKYKFKQHMALHTGEGLISCPYCQYKTPRKYQMKRHITIHTQEGRYSCTICSHTTAYKSAHRKHMAKHGQQVEFNKDDISDDNENPDDPDNESEDAVSSGENNNKNSNSTESLLSNKSSESAAIQPLLPRSLRQMKSRKNSLARVSVVNSSIQIAVNGEVISETVAEKPHSSSEESGPVHESGTVLLSAKPSNIEKQPDHLSDKTETVYMTIEESSQANIISNKEEDNDIDSQRAHEGSMPQTIIPRPTIVTNVQGLSTIASLQPGHIIPSNQQSFINVANSNSHRQGISYAFQNVIPRSINNSEQQLVSTATQTLQAPRSNTLSNTTYQGPVYQPNVVNTDMQHVIATNQQVLSTDTNILSTSHQTIQPTFTTINTNGQVLAPGQSFIITGPGSTGALQDLGSGQLLTSFNGQPTHFTLTPLPSHFTAHITGNTSAGQTVTIIHQSAGDGPLITDAEQMKNN